jgi:hypothetical protein
MSMPFPGGEGGFPRPRRPRPRPRPTAPPGLAGNLDALPSAAAMLRRRGRPTSRPGARPNPPGRALGLRGLSPGHLMQAGLPRSGFVPPGQGPATPRPRPPVVAPQQGGMASPRTALPLLAQFLQRLGGPRRGRFGA